MPTVWWSGRPTWWWGPLRAHRIGPRRSRHGDRGPRRRVRPMTGAERAGDRGRRSGEVLRRRRGRAGRVVPGARGQGPRAARARTAPGRRRRCGCSPRWPAPTAARRGCSGSTSGSSRSGCAAIIGLAGQYAAVDENLTGRENLRLVGTADPPARRDDRAPGRRAARPLRPLRRSQPGGPDVLGRHAPPPRPRRPRSSTSRRCSSSTSPPPGSTPRVATGCGTSSRTSWPAGTTVLLTTQYLEEADHLADEIVVIDHGRGDRPGHGGRPEGPPRCDGDRGRLPRRRRPRTRAAALLASVGEVDHDGTTVNVSVAGGDGASSLLGAVRVLDERGRRAHDARRCTSRPSTTCSCRSPATRRRPPSRR